MLRLYVKHMHPRRALSVRSKAQTRSASNAQTNGRVLNTNHVIQGARKHLRFDSGWSQLHLPEHDQGIFLPHTSLSPHPKVFLEPNVKLGTNADACRLGYRLTFTGLLALELKTCHLKELL